MSSPKLCHWNCGRPVESSGRYKTCCSACAALLGSVSEHDAVCDVRYFQYQMPPNDAQTTSTTSASTTSDSSTSTSSRWQCYLCSHRNENNGLLCAMCNKPKPNKKRKISQLQSMSGFCQESSSPFHVCSAKCVERWGTILTDQHPRVPGTLSEPVTKRCKLESKNDENDFDENAESESEPAGNMSHNHNHNHKHVPGTFSEPAATTWACDLCTAINGAINSDCEVCETPRSRNAPKTAALQQPSSGDGDDEKRRRSSIDDMLQEVTKTAAQDRFDTVSSDDDVAEKTSSGNIPGTVCNSNSNSKEEKDVAGGGDDGGGDHSSDDDVVIEMMQNGVTRDRLVAISHANTSRTAPEPEQNQNVTADATEPMDVTHGSTSENDENGTGNMCFSSSKYVTFNPNKQNMFHNVTIQRKDRQNGNGNEKQKKRNELFEIPFQQYLEQHFTCLTIDSEARYISDLVAQNALNEDEYWDAHTMANTVPFVEKDNDELESYINGFDHGSIAAKTVHSGTKKNAKMVGFGQNSTGADQDEEIDENTVERVNVQKEFSYAMSSGQVVKCRLIRRRQFVDYDDGDTHFRICESQFMRSCSNAASYATGMKRTLKEVIYVVSPSLIRKFQTKKKAMQQRLGVGGVNTILAWHGTPSSNVESIVSENFSLTHLSKNSGDTGWYGAGIYFSEFANISQGYGDALLLCKIMLGKSHKMTNISVGCDQKSGFDSHIAGAQKYGTEIVIFDMDQILPCYICKY